MTAWIQTDGASSVRGIADWLHTTSLARLFRFTETHLVRDDPTISNPAATFRRTQRGRFDRDAFILARGMSAFGRSDIVTRASAVDQEMWTESIRHDMRERPSHALVETVTRLGNLGGRQIQTVTLVSFPGLWYSAPS
jgi:hypothetical protein